MNITRYISTTLLLILTLSASAQKRKNQVVVLNDVTSIVGTVVDDSSGYLRVRIRRPQVITFNKSQVYIAGNVRPGVNTGDDKKGYSIRLSTSILAGRNNNGNVGTMSFLLSNGYQFSNGLSVGFGTGIEELDVLLMPVYADLRFQPLKTRVSPFAWIKSGFGIPLSDHSSEDHYYYDYYEEPKGGIMFSAGTGIALYSWRRNAVSIGMGYRYQTIRFRQKNIWSGESSTELVTSFNRIELQFGFIFM